jgi:hypothetical protein
MLFIAVGLGLAVIAVNSIIATSARGPDAAIAYADRVRPLIDRSTRQAAALDDLRARVGQLPAPGMRQTAGRLVREAQQLVDAAKAVDAPADLVVPNGLLITMLATRAHALAAVEGSVTADEAAPVDDSVNALVGAGRDLVVSDRSYALFLEGLPVSARKTMPASTWVPDPNRWAQPEMAALVATVRASASSTPVHDVSIVTVSPSPAPVGAEGPAQVLPRSKALRLDVVVANAGNAEEKHVAVEAVGTSVGGMNTARQFVDLAPGQRATVPLTLHPASGPTLDVRVRVATINGETKVADNEVNLSYIIR